MPKIGILLTFLTYRSVVNTNIRHRYSRVETKIFVFVFSPKKLTKSYENNENFRENENVQYEKTDAGNGKYC
jgi:hypothetical protein